MSLKISDQPYEQRVERGIDNVFMRQAVASAQERLQTGYHTAAEELGDWEAWRTLGEEIRTHTLENPDYYLEQLSDEVAKRGGYLYFSGKLRKGHDHFVYLCGRTYSHFFGRAYNTLTNLVWICSMNANSESLINKRGKLDWLQQHGIGCGINTTK